MIGTSFAQRGLMLVEQPGAWGRQGLADSDLDHDVAAALQHRADVADLRLLAIRRPDRTAPVRRSWAVRPPGSSTTYWGEHADDTDLLDLPLDDAIASVGEPAEGPTYLVCTHSKRDACCAVFARPLAAALDRLRPGQVWGCSHTGGHRFAPVVVAVPAGSPGAAMYGRVDVGALTRVVEATEAGRVLPELLRGPTGHPAHVQAALAHAYAGHPVPGDWRVLDVRETGPDGWRITLAGPSSYDLEVVAETRAEPMASCGKPEPSDQTHYRVLSSAPR
ncbi:MAG: sucrase ferredoxin [Nocardioidaceae bacterium]|nr:sucrase ferredoxin [Nocardioidaceae bacterium]MCL2614075.1 sucrase ferredoxin [Nocardioidaceae bacterium]